MAGMSVKNCSRDRAGLPEDTSKEDVSQEVFSKEPRSPGWIKACPNYFTDLYILYETLIYTQSSWLISMRCTDMSSFGP